MGNNVSVLQFNTEGKRRAVQIEPQHSIHDARCLIKEQFDEDMLPQPDFHFEVEGIELTKKQEACTKAMALCGQKVHLLPMSKAASASTKRPQLLPPTADTIEQTPPSKRRCQADIAHMPSTPELAIETKASQLTDQSKNPIAQADDSLDFIKKSSFCNWLPDRSCNSTSDFEEDADKEGNENEKQEEDNEEDFISVEDSDAAQKPATNYNAASDAPSSQVLTSDVDVPEKQGSHDKVQDILVVAGKHDTHAKYNQALQQSATVLRQLREMLQKNRSFCSQERRKEWQEEISNVLGRKVPNIVVGVLGNTGEKPLLCPMMLR
jgi:hypothetical protein